MRNIRLPIIPTQGDIIEIDEVLTNVVKRFIDEKNVVIRIDKLLPNMKQID